MTLPNTPPSREPLPESAPSLVSRPFRTVLNQFSKGPRIAPVIASSGRAGSTMLFDAVPASLLSWGPLRNNKRAKIWLTETAWDLERRSFRTGTVYKTHDYPPQRIMPDFTRVIYTFSDPTEVVFSLFRQEKKMGREWISEHYKHLRAPNGDFDQISKADTLQLGSHFHAWMQPQKFPVLCIKYTALWSSEEEISRFLGVKVKLPAYRPRQTDLSQISAARVEQVRSTYAELIREVKDAPDCYFFTGEEPLLSP